jgi:hypothetical protein
MDSHAITMHSSQAGMRALALMARVIPESYLCLSGRDHFGEPCDQCHLAHSLDRLSSSTAGITPS